jgi:very-short-patch-repair endonuclease
MARDAFFKAQSFAVLRFPSNAPFQNLDGVLSAILHQLNMLAGVAPIPAFPQRGKGQDT